MRHSPHHFARARQFFYLVADCKGVLLIMIVAQKVIQQLREEYPAESVDGDEDDAGAGAR
jgi:hypothetical protein